MVSTKYFYCGAYKPGAILTEMSIKRLILMVATLFPISCLAQVDTLTDLRDNKKYRIKTISNTTWMLNNLDYQANYSVGLTEEQKTEFKKFNLHGRYYHFINTDSVCPGGWRLPNTQDWIDYFNFLVKGSPKKIKLETIALQEENYYFSFLNYEKRLDLFKEGNPLNLSPTGRIEGGKFNAPDVYADYYTTDNKETFKGKSHIHIMNIYTTIHSHEHNLQHDKENELRKFMVRCVKQKD
jgi:uncharacterized protein (TIGR02145 family)